MYGVSFGPLSNSFDCIPLGPNVSSHYIKVKFSFRDRVKKRTRIKGETKWPLQIPLNFISSTVRRSFRFKTRRSGRIFQGVVVHPFGPSIPIDATVYTTVYS